jgi:tRNA(adenine34) deaminase
VTGTAGEADRAWMRRALDEARRAAEREEVPVGAVLVGPDGLACADHNRTREAADPTAHAEVRVIRAAAGRLGDWRLLEHTLYVTLEPCAMCAGAIVLARIPRVVFAAPDPKAGMCGSLENLVQDPRLNHRVELEAGLLEEESAELLRMFFAARRGSELGESAPGEAVSP